MWSQPHRQACEKWPECSHQYEVEMSSPIDFWFSIGSTYTYLSVMRIENVERQTGVAFRWCPFDVRAIMVEMDNIPFSNKPAKARYMWRDIERRAKMHGLSWAAIPPYPIKHLSLANRIALVGAREGWAAIRMKCLRRTACLTT
jgi:2-hydroxychromene-2-carboxylate isomerase